MTWAATHTYMCTLITVFSHPSTNLWVGQPRSHSSSWVAILKTNDQLKTTDKFRSGSRIFKRGHQKWLAELWHLSERGDCVWGGWVPSEAEKKYTFQSQFARFSAFFCQRCPHIVRHLISAKNRRGACATCTPSKSALEIQNLLPRSSTGTKNVLTRTLLWLVQLHNLSSKTFSLKI